MQNINATPPVLEHVRWPLAPIVGESLAGFVVRTSNYNALGKPKVLIRDAGLPPQQRVGTLAYCARDLDCVADMLAVDRAWVEAHRHRSVTEGGQRRSFMQDFHGARLRRVHLEYDDRLVAPGALRMSEHHREAWHISTISADVETWEVLLSTCGGPRCAMSLGWTRTRGLGFCEHCGQDLRSVAADLVPEDVRSVLELGASLLSTEVGERENALLQLPELLRSENRGDLFELGWQLGILERKDHAVVSSTPKLIKPDNRAQCLATGLDLLRTWPTSIERCMRDSSRRDPSGLTTALVVTNLRRVISRTGTLGRAATMMQELLGPFHTNHFSTVVGEALGLLTATDFMSAAGVNSSELKKLRTSGLVNSLTLRRRQHRTVAVYSPVQARSVKMSMQTRYTARQCASDFGVGIDAVALWAVASFIDAEIDLVVQHLRPELHVNQQAASGLHRELEGVLLAPTARTELPTLRTAMRRLPSPDKPWVAILDAILNGELRVHRNAGTSLCLRDCRVELSGLPLLNSVRDEVAVPRGWRSEFISDPDAWERLNCGHRNLRALVAEGRLVPEGHFDGRTFRRSEVDAISATSICIAEVTARLGEFRPGQRVTSMIMRSGLRPDLAGFMPRQAACELLNL